VAKRAERLHPLLRTQSALRWQAPAQPRAARLLLGKPKSLPSTLVVASGTRRSRQAATVLGPPSVECPPHHLPPSHGTPATPVLTSLCAAQTGLSTRSTGVGSAWSKWGSLGGKLASGTGPAVSSWSAVVSTSLYKVRTASCGISGGMARRGPAGNPSAEN